MTEVRRGLERSSRLFAGGAILLLALLLGSPVTASAAGLGAQPTGSLVPRPTAAARAAVSPTTEPAKGAPVAPTLDASGGNPPSLAAGGLVARLGEARRTNGVLGQWVVGVLLAILIVLWIALIAIVVRLRLRFAGHGDN